jgi:hypothetical protein
VESHEKNRMTGKPPSNLEYRRCLGTTGAEHDDKLAKPRPSELFPATVEKMHS